MTDRAKALNPLKTFDVLTEVMAERSQQDELWGEQNHPLTNPDYDCLPDKFSDFHAAEAEMWRRISARRVQEGTIAWDGILREEVHEARAEWLQVAAVAVAAIECIDRAAMALRSVTHINPAPPVIGLALGWADDHVPTYADVQKDPKFWISGPGHSRAQATRCPHGYTLVDSCLMCDSE